MNCLVYIKKLCLPNKLNMLYSLSCFANLPRYILTSTMITQPKTRETHKERTNYQNVHVLGGRAAVARKVSANLNSDDEIIVRMKQEKRTDRDIAQALKNAGRVDYHVKTIGSRWKRLRIALAAAKDKELDAGYEDWHSIEVSILKRCLSEHTEIS